MVIRREREPGGEEVVSVPVSRLLGIRSSDRPCFLLFSLRSPTVITVFDGSGDVMMSRSVLKTLTGVLAGECSRVRLYSERFSILCCQYVVNLLTRS